MLKLVYSKTNKKKKYVCFFDDMRSMSGISCKSFVTIDQAIEFAWDHNDMFMGNVDIQYIDYMKEVRHPILTQKRWDFA